MKRLLALTIILAAVMMACNDTTPTPQTNDDDTKKEDPVLSKIHLLTQGEWFIEDAKHDGNHDASSTGKTVEFFEMSSYNFNGSFDGTYSWSQDSTTLYLDKGTNFSQDWKINVLEEGKFEVDFNSPFTGKPSTWKMIIK